MKTSLMLLMTFLISVQVYGQPADPKVTIAGRSDGQITISDLLAAEKIIPNMKDLVILGFILSYDKGDDIIELESKSDKLSQEMKDNIKLLPAGTEISFENIKAKQGEKTLILESIILKLRN